MSVFKPTRRTLLAAGAGSLLAAGGLYVGVKLRNRGRRPSVPPREEAFSPDIYLAVGADDSVKIWLLRAEMGQGVMTSLPLLVADELGADWSRVEVVQAEAHPNYGMMLTAVSGSVSGSYEELLRAGAAAREVLVRTAARRWSVDEDACRAEGGRVMGPKSQSFSFGELAADAARLGIPRWPRLRPRSELKLVGSSPPRIDIPAKTTGAAQFSMDVRRPGMRFAALARPPRFGAKVESFDEAGALAAGAEKVVALESGVAAIAPTTWAAFQAVEALKPTFRGGLELSSDDVEARLAAAARGQDGLTVVSRGAPLELDGEVLEANFRTPYLAHATFEPMSCTAELKDGKLEVWAPTQSPDGLRSAAAGWLGLPETDIRVHTTLIGGAFGRRVQKDFSEEAVRLAAACGYPVKVVFSREDDMRHDFYRPPSHHRLRGRLDAEGWPEAWSHRVASPSIIGQSNPSYDEVDEVAIEGSRIPYAIPRVHVDYANARLGVPVGFWRSVGHSHTAFAVECFLDELGRAGGKDPVELRRRLLKNAPRHLAVLEKAAAAAGWNEPAPPGRARGVAVHSSYGSYVAHVVEVSSEEGRPRVHRVVSAVDAGWIIHPDTVVGQIEGGIIFGLTAALFGRITVEGGAVRESNFHDYPILRLDQTPDIEVHLLASAEAPGGVGEIGVPPIAPALVNAWVALSGRPVRELPLI